KKSVILKPVISCVHKSFLYGVFACKDKRQSVKLFEYFRLEEITRLLEEKAYSKCFTTSQAKLIPYIEDDHSN
ncbi:MAG: hypothetical protein NZM44_04185, partial [Candidatus Calescibacterium sp.]|nr:hypothetical protein [Candidatus Calescibacterium sp.]